MVQKATRGDTSCIVELSKTKGRQGALLLVALFLKSHCAAGVPVCVRPDRAKTYFVNILFLQINTFVTMNLRRL